MYLRNTEACYSKSSNDVSSEFSKIVVPSPTQDREKCFNAEPKLLRFRLVFERTQRLIGKESLLHSCSEFLEEALLGRHANLVSNIRQYPIRRRPAADPVCSCHCLLLLPHTIVIVDTVTHIFWQMKMK